MGKIAKGVNKIHFTMLYGDYCYIIIENFPQKFSSCKFVSTIMNLNSNVLPQLFLLCTHIMRKYSAELKDSQLVLKT